MASSKSKPGQQGQHMTQRKTRSANDKARASGGGLRQQPTEGAPGRSASTGGLASRSSVRDDRNSRSSNAGGRSRQHKA